MCAKSDLQIILSVIAKTAKETFSEQLDLLISTVHMRAAIIRLIRMWIL